MHEELDQVIKRLQVQIVAMLAGARVRVDEMEDLCAKLMEIKIKVRDIEWTLRRYDDMLEMSSCQRY
jgi:hypothetical protein